MKKAVKKECKDNNNKKRASIIIMALCFAFVFIYKLISRKKSKKIDCGDVQFVKHKVGDGLNKSKGSLIANIKKYFIPYEKNDHKPHFLRSRSIKTVALVAIIIKLVISSFLFFNYPNYGKFAAEITTNVYQLVNESRHSAGLPLLDYDPVLTDAAQKKADDMIALSYFSHTSPDGRHSWNWINRDEYPYILAGENLAMDFTDASIAHNALMASPSHKKNIMNKRYGDIGIAVARGMINNKSTIVLVQFFGAVRETDEQDTTTIVTLDTGKEEPTEEISPVEEAKVGIKEDISRPIIEEKIVEEPIDVPVPDQDTKQPLVENLDIKPTPMPPEPIALEIIDNVPGIEEDEVKPLSDEDVEPAEIREPIVAAEISDEKIMKNLPPFNENNFSGSPLLINEKSNKGTLEKLVTYTNVVLAFFLSLTLLSLILSVLIKIKIQHPQLIIQAVVLISVISVLLLSKFHFLEYLH